MNDRAFKETLRKCSHKDADDKEIKWGEHKIFKWFDKRSPESKSWKF